MSAFAAVDELYQALDERTIELLEHRRRTAPFKRRGWLIRRALLSADVAALSLAFLIAEVVYAHHTNRGALNQVNEFLVFVLSLPGWIVASKLYGLYDKDEERADHSTADEFARLFHLLTVCTFLLYAGSLLTSAFNPQFPKLLVFWVIAVIATVILRGLARAYCRRHVSYLQNTVIVGAGDVGQAIARKILKHPEYGLNLVGFVDDQPRERAPGLEYLTLIGGSEDVPDLIELLDIERVVFAFSNDTHDQSLDLIRTLNQMNVQVDVVPRFFEVLSPAAEVHSIEGIPMWSLPRWNLPRSSQIVKRALDLVGATVGLVVLAPFFALIAVAIKLDSRGPVFFQQLRMGRGSRAFRIVKLRTMAVDADARKAELAHLNKHARDGGDPRMFKIDSDPRVTRVGRILRRFSIDELPQLWNVLCGEMSLVGPRPLILDEHAYVTDWAERRLDLRPGITGLWQVLGRDDIPFDEMVKLDYLYVTSWTLGGDIRLLLRTVPVLNAARGA